MPKVSYDLKGHRSEESKIFELVTQKKKHSMQNFISGWREKGWGIVDDSCFKGEVAASYSISELKQFLIEFLKLFLFACSEKVEPPKKEEGEKDTVQLVTVLWCLSIRLWTTQNFGNPSEVK